MGPDNGLLPACCQVSIRPNVNILLIGQLHIFIGETLTEFILSLNKIHVMCRLHNCGHLVSAPYGLTYPDAIIIT